MRLKFRKVLVSKETFESAGVMDVNGNGHPDIVSGSWWYEGPGFKKRHFIGDIQTEGEYYDDFSTIALDVNNNGRPDFITGGWWGNTLRWRENPEAPEKEWPEHIIAETGNVETTRAWDIDGDGKTEIIPNTPGGPVRIFKLNGNGTFKCHTIYPEAQGHGLGCGDVAGNGRMDIVLAKGWLEAPADPYQGKWKWHPEFNLRSASVPIIIADVNGDGVNDLIVGQSHAYGLSWWEQKTDNGSRTWTEHPIDPDSSQYHDLQWIDIDNDGQCELVTGKRYRAHCGNDPGADDPIGVYYFKWDGQQFVKNVIDHGPAGTASGLGIHFATADLTGNGWLDIVAPGKDGLYVFYNLGNS